jgi:hypothetical protein
MVFGEHPKIILILWAKSAHLVRCRAYPMRPASRCARRLPEWPDLTPSNGSTITSVGISLPVSAGSAVVVKGL